MLGAYAARDGRVRFHLPRVRFHPPRGSGVTDAAAPGFQGLMRAVCLRLGATLNQAELARDTGIPRTTVQRYLNLLEISYQLVRLEPYSVNRTKRLVKSPKLYWSDTGLALHLAGASEATGAHLENIICTELLAWREIDVARPAISTGAPPLARRSIS